MAEARQIVDRRPPGQPSEAVGPECARALGKAAPQAIDDAFEVALFDNPADDLGRGGFDHNH